MIKYSKIMALFILGLFLCCNVASAVQIGGINHLNSKEINTSWNMDLKKVPVQNSSSKNKELKKPTTKKQYTPKKQKTTSPQITYKKITKNQTTKNNTSSTLKNDTSIPTLTETSEKNQTVEKDTSSIPTLTETSEKNQTVENNTVNNTLENNTSMEDANHIKDELKKDNISVVVSIATIQGILNGTANLYQGEIVQLFRNGKFMYAIYQGYDNGNFFLNFGESMDRCLSYNNFCNLYTGIKLTAINGSSVVSALDKIDEIQNTPSGYQKRMDIASKILQYTAEITGILSGLFFASTIFLAVVPEPGSKAVVIPLGIITMALGVIAGVCGMAYTHLYDWF